MSASSQAFGFSTTTDHVTEGLDLSGKTYLVTGANSGLGRETARALSAKGAYIIATGRTADKASAALAELGCEGLGLACELSDLTSVRACVAAVAKLDRPLDGIIANAGIMALPEAQLQQGVELQLFTNHIGHFTLITGLLERLTDSARVVVVSSAAHMGAPEGGVDFDNLDGSAGYHPWKMYGQSKLANILFTKALARRFEGSQRVANTLHPGVIETNLLRHQMDAAEALLDRIGRENIKSIPQGAATQVFLAVHPDGAQHNGKYFDNCQVTKPLPAADDRQLADRLWAWSESVVAAG